MYSYQLDATGAVLIALLSTLALALPLLLALLILLPLWRAGGLTRWIDRQPSGHKDSAVPTTAPTSTSCSTRPLQRLRHLWAPAATSCPTSPVAATEAPEAPERALLSFKDIRYSVSLPGSEGPLQVLKGVSGVLRPGSLTAIMGPSGCGKSTLLDVLADTKRVGRIEGDVLLNGRRRDSRFRSVCAYVPQDDCLHATLTVRETLWFVCELRLSPSVRRAERLARISETLRDVDLTHLADARVGDDFTGGLSGGQRRRVTIATELISRPQLILLDEPTSGLDAYGAEQVISTLRRFAARGQTLACTIHQPRAEAFALFHQLILMRGGETMYCGAVSRILPYLQRCGVSVDEHVNPADLVVDLTHTRELGPAAECNPAAMDAGDAGSSSGSTSVGTSLSEGSLDLGSAANGSAPLVGLSATDLVTLYTTSWMCLSLNAELASIHDGTHPKLPRRGIAAESAAAAAAAFPNSLWKQTVTLFRRQHVIDMRDFGYKFIWLLNAVVLALNALTFLNVVQPSLSGFTAAEYRDGMDASRVCSAGDANASTLETLNADVLACGRATTVRLDVTFAHRSLLFLVINALFINESLFVSAVHFDKRVFAREHAAHAYPALAWHCVWLLKMAVTAAIKALLYTPCFYFIARLRHAWHAYVAAAFVTGGMSFAGSAASMLIASTIPSLGAATTAFGCAVLVFQNVCGFYIPLKAVPPYFIWLSWSSVFMYGYNALINAQDMGEPTMERGLMLSDRLVWVFIFFTYCWGLLFHLGGCGATLFYHSEHAEHVPFTGEYTRGLELPPRPPSRTEGPRPPRRAGGQPIEVQKAPILSSSSSAHVVSHWRLLRNRVVLDGHSSSRARQEVVASHMSHKSLGSMSSLVRLPRELSRERAAP